MCLEVLDERERDTGEGQAWVPSTRDYPRPPSQEVNIWAADTEYPKANCLKAVNAGIVHGEPGVREMM